MDVMTEDEIRVDERKKIADMIHAKAMEYHKGGGYREAFLDLWYKVTGEKKPNMVDLSLLFAKRNALFLTTCRRRKSGNFGGSTAR